MKRRILLTVLLLATTLLGIGCTTTMIDPGTDSSATYRFGRLTTEENRDIASVYQATETAMSQLGLNIIQKVKDELEAKVVARDAQDKKIIIELIALTKDNTQVKIHVSSSDKARRIFQTIHDALP